MPSPKPQEIWLVRFPFSDLKTSKLRPALVIAVHREEVIILGIFSKIADNNLRDAWVLMPEEHPEFYLTGLKKTSLIRADKIATVSKSVFHNQIGTLPADILLSVKAALKQSLNIP